MLNAYAFSFPALDGSSISLSSFVGKVLLVVNTASQCGFTPQYAGLEELYQKYKDQGLVIIGVPSNDFGHQEPGSAHDIQCFIKDHFTVTFPMAAKQHVSGDEADPFYKWANAQVGFIGSPKWNFHKFLIDKQGNLVDWFSSITSPTSGKVTKAIEKELAKK